MRFWITTNRIEEQEVSVLALHLLQTVLVEPKWAGRITPEDYRGLTPLIYSHVNPYGRFDLDLNSRIDFGRLPFYTIFSTYKSADQRLREL